MIQKEVREGSWLIAIIETMVITQGIQNSPTYQITLADKCRQMIIKMRRYRAQRMRSAQKRKDTKTIVLTSSCQAFREGMFDDNVTEKRSKSKEIILSPEGNSPEKYLEFLLFKMIDGCFDHFLHITVTSFGG